MPLILIATAAAGAVARTTKSLSVCAPTADMREAFTIVTAKATTVSSTIGETVADLCGCSHLTVIAVTCTDTNFLLLILKGVKMLFMSALVQFAIWNLLRCLFRKKKSKK